MSIKDKTGSFGCPIKRRISARGKVFQVTERSSGRTLQKSVHLLLSENERLIAEKSTISNPGYSVYGSNLLNLRNVQIRIFEILFGVLSKSKGSDLVFRQICRHQFLTENSYSECCKASAVDFLKGRLTRIICARAQNTPKIIKGAIREKIVIFPKIAQNHLTRLPH